MASSSSLAHNWTYDVYASFPGGEVRITFPSHFRKQFKDNGISMFDEQEIIRSQNRALALKQAIRGSRIAIIVLSEMYASSSWYFDELVEILKCKEELGQVVIPIYYRVDPSHVRNQTGSFGNLFEETCAGKTEEERQKWSQALHDVSNIEGEDFRNWDDEADMIEKIAKDISNILNSRPIRDFEEWADVVGRVETNHDDRDRLLRLEYEPPSSNEQIEKSWYSTGMAFLVVINLLVEIASATADQLSSITFARISLGIPQSDVRNQTGDFGEGFKRTCVGKTEEVRKRWIHALSNASNIVGGEDFLNWVFDDMVGIEGHLEKMESLLNLEYEDEALIVGIYGHAGIAIRGFG
ncbi:hypothetical protein AALP_AA6G005300 [Arabis alpina]|uniref:TIR domain-containing protein n=1 Tax=Arabis alpina TaxID=50452 RepID=A0A087GL68_ARAAL|nr:hypothetical protein AALP_AA6G005300 [Arabis alpina]